MEIGPRTWHYGVVARWWAEFNVSGPEIDYFRGFVEAGQPALDVACGTGRLLIPYLREGLDVDGCDISEDMLSLCRERAEAEGLSPQLYAQPMHRLDLPRRYHTILICGGFGLGGNRDHDLEALRRCYRHLEPGGTLIVDNEVPYSSRSDWRYWPKTERTTLPTSWRGQGERRRGHDGTEYELRSRLVDLDPLVQRAAYQMHASMWRDAVLVAEEEHLLQLTLYFANEIALMLANAGFTSIDLRAGYNDAAPTADDDFVVFIAKKPRR
jgi:SAM-dependent methyltransferase